MIKFSVNQLFDYLSDLSPADVEKELYKYGWKKTMFHKQFSKVYIDNEGQIQKLNAENDKVERIALTAA